jgi:YbbR domain-containing protein|tara:strand:- start:680 stop:1636 length:957 start_codon:yes stop_codon:yes gene_type:complete
VSARRLFASLARDGKLKLAAFGLAVFLWVLGRVGNPGQRDLLIPVEIRLADPNWVVLTDPVPDTVRVFFRGPQSEIFRITGFDLISVTVPITEMSDEEMVFQLQPGWVSVDGYRGVEVDDIVPGEINVRLDRRSIRTVPLRVSTSGALPDHLALEGDLTLTPDVVQVDGPASLVDRLDSLDIVPVSLSDVDGPARVGTFVDTVGMGPVTVDPYTIALRVPAAESTERVFTGVRVITYLVEGTGPVEVFPENVRVTVTGARSRVSAMDPDILRAVVPSGELLDLGEVEDRRVPIRVEGVPSYVSVVVSVDTVSVRRVEQ